MYCQHCGAKLTDDGLCPNCEAAMPDSADNQSGKKESRKIPSKGARSYAAILTALLVFPASLSIAIDLSFHRYDFWFGYVVGALFVAWVCLVLPVMDITPAPVTALICFTSICGYIFYIMHKTGHLAWLYQRALPLFILFAVFVAIDVAMISAKKFKVTSIFSVISFEIGIYLIAVELFSGKTLETLHWSPILASGFFSVAAVLFAFSYIWKINK